MESKQINHVLIVEDDKEIREGVEIYLRSQGYEVFQAADGVEGLAVIEREEIHLAIVDVMMPRMDGIQMTIKLREKYDFPVIFLSAKSEEVDKILGLNMGADDYVTKPLRPRELVARIKAALRKGGKASSSFNIGGLLVDTASGIVKKNGSEIFLSALEYRLLLVFVSNPKSIITRDRLLNELWDAAGEFVTDNALTVYIKRLREKIEDDPGSPEDYPDRPGNWISAGGGVGRCFGIGK